MVGGLVFERSEDILDYRRFMETVEFSVLHFMSTKSIPVIMGSRGNPDNYDSSDSSDDFDDFDNSGNLTSLVLPISKYPSPPLAITFIFYITPHLLVLHLCFRTYSARCLFLPRTFNIEIAERKPLHEHYPPGFDPIRPSP